MGWPLRQALNMLRNIHSEQKNVNSKKLTEEKEKVEQTNARLVGKINAKTSGTSSASPVTRKQSTLFKPDKKTNSRSEMDQYLAYLPESEGFLPKWLFFVSSTRVHPNSHYHCHSEPLASNASIPQSNHTLCIGLGRLRS